MLIPFGAMLHELAGPAGLRQDLGQAFGQPWLTVFAWLGLLVAGFAGVIIQAALLWPGRWRPWTRQAEIAYGLITCIVLTWAVAAGPVFKAAPTDQAARGAASLIILVTLTDLAARARRQHVREAVEIRDGG
ncbi:MAG: hypothetical protein ACRDRJ_04965 [Streptosporangiaceae bacterium]